MNRKAWEATATLERLSLVPGSRWDVRRRRKLPTAGEAFARGHWLASPSALGASARTAAVRDMASLRRRSAACRSSLLFFGIRANFSRKRRRGRTTGTRKGIIKPSSGRMPAWPTPPFRKTVAAAATRSFSLFDLAALGSCVLNSTPKAVLPTTSKVMSPNMRQMFTSFSSTSASERRPRSLVARSFMTPEYSARVDGLKVGCQAPRRDFAWVDLEFRRLDLSNSSCSWVRVREAPRKGFILSAFLRRIFRAWSGSETNTSGTRPKKIFITGPYWRCISK
mmetsp:Transcript_30639/g.86661  ORF Transcript_30639/g.86661 Transcript_30639/m.86661 type:complete len:280 (+) Transcript_30639:834-1673(+)